MKYSPSPWNIEEHEGHARSYRFVICAPNYDNRVAVISLNGEARGDNDIARANARLIAAAPDLLDSLIALVDYLEYMGVPEDCEGKYEDAMSAIDMAIKGEK